MRLLLLPNYSGPDLRGDGGIRRIVEAQKKYLPQYGVEVVDQPPYDCIALHAGDWPRDSVPASIPIVAHCHGLYWGEYAQLWDKGTVAVNNRVVHNLLRANRNSVCSEFVARAVRKALWIEPEVIYHGVDPDEWTDVPLHVTPYQDVDYEAGTYVLWNKARVDAICDPTPLARLAELLPNVPFVTTLMPIDTTTLGCNIYVTGTVGYTQSQIMTKSADVYLGTTRGTFDISVVEAMLCGVPVLGWNWGSLREIVTHKVHGYLAEVGNYDDLVAGYHYIQQHRPQLSKACIARVTPAFTWKHIVGQYAAMYASVAS